MTFLGDFFEGYILAVIDFGVSEFLAGIGSGFTTLYIDSFEFVVGHLSELLLVLWKLVDEFLTDISYLEVILGSVFFVFILVAIKALLHLWRCCLGCDAFLVFFDDVFFDGI